MTDSKTGECLNLFMDKIDMAINNAAIAGDIEDIQKIRAILIVCQTELTDISEIIGSSCSKILSLMWGQCFFN